MTRFLTPATWKAEGFQERRQQYDNGDFGFIGIQAEAEIVVAGVCQTITSGGLWGIESDSTPDYLSEIEQEEIEQLQEILHALGFSLEVISEHTAKEHAMNEPRYPICPDCQENLTTLGQSACMSRLRADFQRRACNYSHGSASYALLRFSNSIRFTTTNGHRRHGRKSISPSNTRTAMQFGHTAMTR